MKKIVKLNLNVLNEKNSLLIKQNITDIKDLKNNRLKTIKIDNTIFDLTDNKSSKELEFNGSFFKPINDTDIIPIPSNFKTVEPMVADITMAEQAIRYTANAYKELITDIPEKVRNLENKFNFVKNWKSVDINMNLIVGKWYLLIRNDPSGNGQDITGKGNYVYNDYYIFQYSDRNSSNPFLKSMAQVGNTNVVALLNKVNIVFNDPKLRLQYHYDNGKNLFVDFDQYHTLYEYIGNDEIPVFLGKPKNVN